MSRQISELEGILGQLIQEHVRLLAQATAHGAAMQAFDLRKMDDIGREQESARLRITSLEQRRRAIVQQIAKAMNLSGDLTIARLAVLNPEHAQSLLALRAQLKEVVEQVAARAKISGKVAGAVLGHLNTVVRLLAGAVERAGLYTKNGVPRVSSRIGGMEAVG
jgi:phosphoserine phosphatase